MRMEYYFQDQLRWSFGFENPNKAAALIASLLPLWWALAQAAWALRRGFIKWMAVAVGGAVLCAGWWLLFMTFSRGGIVGAAAGFLYVGWRSRAALAGGGAWMRKWVALLLVLLVAGLFGASNAALRSSQGLGTGDGSVTNRFELWQGGLRMIAQIPQGVGTRNSGSAYMQWFQPLESTPRYRTLVNSYLTFAAEQGIGVFALAVFGVVLLWRWPTSSASLTASAKEQMEGLNIGARGSLIAFAVAGFFSTTMEEPALWLAPAFCGAVMVIGIWRSGIRFGLLLAAGRALVASAAICAGMFAAGAILSWREPLMVRLHQGEVALEPRFAAARRCLVWVDEGVLGSDYGKLMRELALKQGANVRVALEPDPKAHRPGETLIVTGDTVSRLDSASAAGALVLIAPSRLEERQAAEILRGVRKGMLFTPSFDEDGRSAAWNKAAAEAGVPVRVIDGVGSQVDSVWSETVPKLGLN